MAKVITIPATRSRYTAAPINSRDKRKVAGYARVSTDHEEQQTSYEAQVDYYTNYIKGREDWEFVSVYTELKLLLNQKIRMPIGNLWLIY